MVTLKEEAINYQAPQKLNIADLSEVPTDIEVLTNTGTNDKGEEYSYKYASINGNEYRIPAPVLEQIKAILKLRPDVKKIKVHKTGSGLGTRYSTDPIL